MSGELMTFASFAQDVIDFVREHQIWGPPIVFALAFGESLAFISLFIPAWADPGRHRRADSRVRHSVLADPGRRRARRCRRRLALLLDRHHVQGADRPCLAAVETSRSAAARPCLHGALGDFGNFHRPLLRPAAGFGAADRRHLWKCLTGIFQFANITSAFVWAYVLLIFGDFGFEHFQMVHLSDRRANWQASQPCA